MIQDMKMGERAGRRRSEANGKTVANRAGRVRGRAREGMRFVLAEKAQWATLAAPL